ncbi:histidine kinase [Paracoccus aerius]
MVIQGRPRGYVFIATDPAEEIALAWRNLSAFLGLAALASVVQGLLILLATRQALRPVMAIASRLADLRRGDLAARVGPVAQRDLTPIAAGVDDLAQALQQAQADRARLQRRVVTRGDEERKAVARDLHDEMGPCLFGLRVEADALRQAATTPAIEAHAQAIAQIAEEIARVNRALLGDLRPMAIGQLPLATVLGDYVADLGRRFPDLDIDLDLAPGMPEPDEATALTLFRILQEGTTNALRHAGAERVIVRLWTDPAHWRMVLSDDGRGMAPGSREGTGLTGMRERITLLGGDLTLSSGAGEPPSAPACPCRRRNEGQDQMKSALVIDDHPITHLGANRLLRDLGYDRIGQAMSGEDALAQLSDGEAPDLIVLDISLPGAGAGPGDALARRRARCADPDLLDERPDRLCSPCPAGRRAGFPVQERAPADFREAVRVLETGEFYLSPKHAMALATLRAGASADPLGALSDRERQVLALIGRGFSLQAIADELEVSYKTAANTSSALKKKLGVDGINGLMKFALDSGV